MKLYIKRFLTIVSLIIIPLVFVAFTQTRIDHNTYRIQSFYQEEKNSIDVVLFGASDVFTGYSPAYAYGKYGFTSFSYAIDANYIELFRNQIKEVLNYQKPKCIVIETTGARVISDGDEKSTDLATMRKWTDVMPLSFNKINTINQFADSEKLSYYLPFLMYHGDISNFSTINEKIAQQIRGFSYLKGIITTNKKTPVDNLIDVSDDNATSPLPESVELCLSDLLDYCDSLDCKVIFARFPHRITNQSEYVQFKVQNQIGKLISKKGFEFLNFDKKSSELQLDLKNDFYGNSHLNVHGQIKFTNYIGRMLTEEYGIMPTNLSSENKQRWDKSFEYTELFYQYYNIHENDEGEYWWYENQSLLNSLCVQH